MIFLNVEIRCCCFFVLIFRWNTNSGLASIQIRGEYVKDLDVNLNRHFRQTPPQNESVFEPCIIFVAQRALFIIEIWYTQIIRCLIVHLCIE